VKNQPQRQYGKRIQPIPKQQKHLGLIRDVSIDDESVQLKMILTTPFCPYAPALMEMTRSKAIEAMGIEAMVELGMEMWEPSMMEDGTGGDWGLF